MKTDDVDLGSLSRADIKRLCVLLDDGRDGLGDETCAMDLIAESTSDEVRDALTRMSDPIDMSWMMPARPAAEKDMSSLLLVDVRLIDDEDASYGYSWDVRAVLVEPSGRQIEIDTISYRQFRYAEEAMVNSLFTFAKAAGIVLDGSRATRAPQIITDLLNKG